MEDESVWGGRKIMIMYFELVGWMNVIFNLVGKL